MPENEDYVGEVLSDEYWIDEPDRFIGRVDSITVRPMSIGDELQDRIVVEIKNLIYSSTVLGFFSPSKRPNSKWGRWRKAIVETGVAVQSTPEIVGLYFAFERQDWSFGGDFVARGVPAPMEFIDTAEEAEERADLMAVELGVERTPEDTTSDMKLTAEEEYLMNLVCGAIDGKNYAAFLQAVLTVEDIMTNPTFMAPLVDPQHAYVNTLVDHGILTLDEDGAYHAVFAE